MVIKWFTFLLHIWKVPVSDLAQTGYPHWGFSCVSTLPRKILKRLPKIWPHCFPLYSF
jgi:hypothetical protein